MLGTELAGRCLAQDCSGPGGWENPKRGEQGVGGLSGVHLCKYGCRSLVLPHSEAGGVWRGPVPVSSPLA